MIEYIVIGIEVVDCGFFFRCESNVIVWEFRMFVVVLLNYNVVRKVEDD